MAENYDVRPSATCATHTSFPHARVGCVRADVVHAWDWSHEFADAFLPFSCMRVRLQEFVRTVVLSPAGWAFMRAHSSRPTCSSPFTCSAPPTWLLPFTCSLSSYISRVVPLPIPRVAGAVVLSSRVPSCPLPIPRVAGAVVLSSRVPCRHACRMAALRRRAVGRRAGLAHALPLVPTVNLPNVSMSVVLRPKLVLVGLPLDLFRPS